MKDYSKMSDFEINSATYNFALDLGYDLVFLGDDVIEWRKDGEVIITVKVDYTKNGLRDYCNNPSDAWPIIKVNHINIGWAGDEEWLARTVHTAKVFDTNPLRAAMIVYLMMKDEEK